MPLPYPRMEEKKKDFMDRCLENETMMLEFRDVAQRYAVCARQWETSGPAQGVYDRDEDEGGMLHS